jgi:ABC-type microcin C transport system permease subunit YejE
MLLNWSVNDWLRAIAGGKNFSFQFRFLHDRVRQVWSAPPTYYLLSLTSIMYCSSMDE